MTSEAWFTQACEDARVAWREGVSNDQEFAQDLAEIAEQYMDLVTGRMYG